MSALGLLVSNYAKVETLLQVYARRLLGMDDARARIVFAGVRVCDLLTRIRGLQTVSQVDAATVVEYETLEKQIRRISEARHLLVHNGVSITEDDSVLSHKGLVSRAVDTFQEQYFTVEALTAIANDLGCIAVRLLDLAHPGERMRFEDSSEFTAMLQADWRF
jgi:hypothetical protein